jgi:hypothetical protein
MWYCHRCRCAREAIMERGKPKTRMFGSGYVAVFLCCGHTAAVNHDKR